MQNKQPSKPRKKGRFLQNVSPKRSKIIIVDQQDRVIGYKKRANVKPTDIHRVSALWITNKQGKILLARRGLTKVRDPGCWGPAVAGTVEKGESYQDNIIRETREELGVKKLDIQPGIKTHTRKKYSHFTQWFFAEWNRPLSSLKIEKEEVEEIAWFSKKRLVIEFKKHPERFINSMKKYVELFVLNGKKV